MKCLLVLPLLVLVTCSGECGTRQTKVKPYEGKSGISTPHWNIENTSHIPSQCTGSMCSYFFTVRVMLHNPTNREVTADVKCVFAYEDGYEGDGNKRSNIKIPANHSRGVELQDLVYVEEGSINRITTRCEVAFMR